MSDISLIIAETKHIPFLCKVRREAARWTTTEDFKASWRYVHDDSYLSYIVLNDEQPVGYVVLEDTGAEYDVSIAFKEGARLKGVGSVALKEALRLHNDKPATAHIHADNTISRGFFMKQGFKPEHTLVTYHKEAGQ